MPTNVPGEPAELEDTLSLAADSRPKEPEPQWRIGPYRLLHLIGEGGMGEVWVAEQLEPVRRKVALKVIKAGMDTKQVVARFESERQALALMDHPAIAKVFDGGSTSEGRPYFVMEYVAGVRITDHCDTQKLSTRSRLELFAEVCEGVQHAHQKAIIHRDLKPSNILVALVDGKAQPKIIDFGIAKATGYRLTEKTLFTEVGAVIGTPEYMSPEQADLTSQDVDTRTDVYSLGVVLYQLLTGELPFGSRDLRSSSYEEFRRKLKEAEPPKPSSKLSTLGEDAAEAAKNRDTDPGALRRQLEGDLDAITMKALEKERARRYATPSELAADIARHLRNEPVVARPSSQAYRLQKYVRRHRAGVVAGLGLVLVLVGFATTMGLQARRIASERDRANAERDRANTERDRANRAAAKSTQVTQFLTDMFRLSTPGEALGNSITARQVLDNATKEIDATLGRDPELQGELMYAVAEAYERLSLSSRAKLLFAQAVDTQRRALGPEHPDTLRSMSALALALTRTGSGLPQAEKLTRDTLDIQRRLLGQDHVDTLQSMSLLGNILRGERRLAEAEKLQKETLDIRRRVFGPDDRLTLWSMLSFARTRAAEGNLVEAEQLERDALATYRRVLGPEDGDTLRAMYALAELLLQSHRLTEAETLRREALDILRRVRGPDHQGTLEAMDDLAAVLSKQGRHAEAEQLQREALGIRRRVLGPESPEVALSQYDLACQLARQGKRRETLALLRESLDHGLDPKTAGSLSKDPDLNSLHGDPRFEELVAKAKTRMSAAH